MQLEALERGESVEFVSDDYFEDVKGLRAGYYPGWENDIDPNIKSDPEELLALREEPEWRKNAVGKSYGMVWLDVEINPSSGCGWGTNYASNCNLVNEFVHLL